jgi:hypothetical protein
MEAPMMAVFDLTKDAKPERPGRSVPISILLALFIYSLGFRERDWQPSETKDAKYIYGSLLAFFEAETLSGNQRQSIRGRP